MNCQEWVCAIDMMCGNQIGKEENSRWTIYTYNGKN